MIILNENETLKIKLKDAHTTTQRDFSVAYGDSTGSILSEGGNKGRFSSTPVVMADHPAAGQKRIVKGFTVSNNDTVKGKFIIYIDDGNNETIVHQHPLNVGESFDSLASNNGGGGMEKSTYDPNLMESDAFNMDNMNDGTTKHYATTEQINTWDSKQDKLYSGVNIKTLNGIDLQGSGNIELDDITKVSKVTLSDYVAGENINVGEYGFSHTIGQGNDDVEIGHTTKRVATSFVGNGGTVEDVTLKIKKVGTPIADLNFRIETDVDGKPSGQLIDPDAVAVSIKQADLTASYQDVILESVNAGIFHPSVNLQTITQSDSVLGGITFRTEKRTFLKSLKIDENCSANKILFWYRTSPTGEALGYNFYNISDGVATLNIELPSGAYCYVICVSNDLTGLVTSIRDNNATYPLTGKGINITSGFAYDDTTLITELSTKTIYYNNDGTTTLAANASDGQKFRAKHWTKISKVNIHSDAGNLLKCEIWNEDKTTKLGETQTKNGTQFVFADPVEISKGQTFHILLTAGQIAYTNLYYFNNYSSHAIENNDLEWLSDTAGNNIWKMIDSIELLTYSTTTGVYNIENSQTLTASNNGYYYYMFGNSANDWTYHAGIRFTVLKDCSFYYFPIYCDQTTADDFLTRQGQYYVSPGFQVRTQINSDGWTSPAFTIRNDGAVSNGRQCTVIFNNAIALRAGQTFEIQWRVPNTNNDGAVAFRDANAAATIPSNTYLQLNANTNDFYTNNPNSREGNNRWFRGKIGIQELGKAGFVEVPTYSNITEINVAEDVTLPKGVKCWLVGYAGTYGNESMDETSYYSVKSSNLPTELSETTTDGTNWVPSNKNMYMNNGPILTDYILKPRAYCNINSDLKGCSPLIVPKNVVAGQYTEADISGYLEYISGLNDGPVWADYLGSLTQSTTNAAFRIGSIKNNKFIMQPELNVKFYKQPYSTSGIYPYLYLAGGYAGTKSTTSNAADITNTYSHTATEDYGGGVWTYSAINTTYMNRRYLRRGNNLLNQKQTGNESNPNVVFQPFDGSIFLYKGDDNGTAFTSNNGSGTNTFMSATFYGPRIITLKTWSQTNNTNTSFEQNSSMGTWTADRDYYGPFFVQAHGNTTNQIYFKLQINGQDQSIYNAWNYNSDCLYYVGTYHIKKGDTVKLYQYTASNNMYTSGFYFGNIL